MAYIMTTKYKGGSNCPDGCVFIETELICDDDEARDAFFELFEANQACEDVCTVIDDYTDEDIELNLTDYFDNTEIDRLNEAFMEYDDWTERQLRILVDVK